MRKNNIAMSLAICLCLTLTACTGKLTTIRPTLITRIVAEELATGIKTEHHRKTNPQLDELMDELVLQMERQYKHTSMCNDSGEYLYEASFYMGDKLELNVWIHSDGSVCKNGKYYILSEKAESTKLSVDLEKWSDFIYFSPEK
ncbi:MAG: hypothetical protein GX858_01415 [Clostridiales bacterium]|nr:hypothetical protein [Clostridiales bacterium]